MKVALDKIAGWMAAGEPTLFIVVAALVALCFFVFNTLRIFLYVPQLRTCWRDTRGCASINLWTRCSWVVSNASTALYMWLFQNDALGTLFFLGNATMCGATVFATVRSRRRHSRPAATTLHPGVRLPT